MLGALKEWAEAQAAARPELRAVGCFGSYARGDAGFGSDLDLVAIVDRSDCPPLHRLCDWPFEALPVPADLLVYTVPEWRRLVSRGDRFSHVMAREVVWVIGGPPP
ncbi:nucleotidyltransferase domain-containing protein [Candidatus Palauibacter sp.]|uniref:nucleotidyltransferase domain-containing protein n=1 Tax=Candidatus Palauibacter sp. TaxID=3101350 RepID=UPI003AF26C46